MLFTDCRHRFAAYVADNLRLEVQIESGDQPLQVDEEFGVRVVDSNHPGGVIDLMPSDDPPAGSNLQDVRFHITASPPYSILFRVDSALEGTTFRSGWDVDSPVLTPGDWVHEMYVHFAPEHPTFDLPTDDPLDDLRLRGQAKASGQVVATARATPRWRELSRPAQSPAVDVSPAPS